MKRPNFFIVGAPKCGTTAMNDYLKTHPDIFIPELKELHFFGHDLKFEKGAFRNKKEYLDLFKSAGSEKRIGESSVFYLYSKSAAHEIKEFSPDAKIVIMLRNPVDVMYSLHSQNIWSGGEDIEDFAGALEAENDRKQGRRLPQYHTYFKEETFYRDIVRFSEQVQRYFEVFGRENVHVIIFEDFKNELAREYKKTLQFLGVDDNFLPDLEQINKDSTVINANKRPRSRFLRDLLNDPPAWIARPAKAVLPYPFILKTLEKFIFLNTRFEKRKGMDPELKKRLQKECAAEIEALGNLVQRDLTYRLS